MFIDTHAHIVPTFFPDKEVDDISAIIEDMRSHGIGSVINIGTNIPESKEVLTISHAYPDILYPACGLHPEYAANMSFEEIDRNIAQLDTLLSENTCIAIGEFGLDYKGHAAMSQDEARMIQEKQKYMLKAQIALGDNHHLPYIIHCREAYEDFLDVVNTYPDKQFQGVLHSLDGDLTTIQSLIARGFFVSFNGILTFKNAEHIRTLAQEIDTKHIILETDSPFLAPVPVRGTKNTPANVRHVYEYMSTLKGIPLEELTAIINNNVHTLFGI